MELGKLKTVSVWPLAHNMNLPTYLLSHTSPMKKYPVAKLSSVSVSVSLYVE